MNRHLSIILGQITGHIGAENAVSAPQMEAAVGISERTIRRLLAEAYHDGTLEELELPAVGRAGVGFYIANDIEDFQMAYDAARRSMRSLERKAAAIFNLAKSCGLHLLRK